MRTSLYGWTGKVLHIDLGTGEMAAQYPAAGLYRTCLGGRGLAGHFLRPFCTLETTEPDLPMLIFTGPLTGTGAPASDRATLMSRSPLTGGVCDSSVGGTLAVQLKLAGWDGLMITGQSDTLCTIEIRDDDVRILPTDLAGATTDEVHDRLVGDAPDDVAVAAIGPAAENGARFASVVVDRRHAAARGGLGLVWAHKNLKAVTVRGSGQVPVHDPEGLARAREDILRLMAASPALLGRHGFSRMGTAALYDLTHARRMMPTDNFARTWFPEAPALNAAAYHRAYSPVGHGCGGCPIKCRLLADDGRAMPDYEPMAHFTALIGNRDMELVMQANQLCLRLGLDPLSAASTLACHREITGEELTPRTVIKSLYDMAHGGSLRQGALDFAQSCHRPELAMAVKGMELPAYDPRGAYGMALAYAVNTRGGCHQHAYPVSHEILRKPVATDRFSFSGKARIIKLAEDVNAVMDCLGVCRFASLAAGLEEYARAYTAATGVCVNGPELMTLGEGVCYAERIMNAENGFDACDDDLPPRFFTEPGSSGGDIEIPAIDRAAFLEARRKYYVVRGLDEDGRPTRETATRLGLEVRS
jgi:aldehyde:ferredoxin oxidoreductase